MSDQNQPTIVDALQAKVKQDKLDQRRTTLSAVDRAFVRAVGAIAEAEKQTLDTSVQNLVDHYTPDEAAEEAEEQAGISDIRPPANANNDDLKAFMDENGIDYGSNDKKSVLNDKIDEWAQAQLEEG